jgi:hypothetical protein
MEKETPNNYLVWIFGVLLLICWQKSDNLNDDNLRLESIVDEYQSALEEANSNIENAQSYAWSDYEEMGYALDNLQTVSEPY